MKQRGDDSERGAAFAQMVCRTCAALVTVEKPRHDERTVETVLGIVIPSLAADIAGQRARIEPAEHLECLFYGREARIALATTQNPADLGANGPRIGHEYAVRDIVVVAPNDIGHESNPAVTASRCGGVGNAGRKR